MTPLARSITGESVVPNPSQNPEPTPRLFCHTIEPSAAFSAVTVPSSEPWYRRSITPRPVWTSAASMGWLYRAPPSLVAQSCWSCPTFEAPTVVSFGLSFVLSTPNPQVAQSTFVAVRDGAALAGMAAARTTATLRHDPATARRRGAVIQPRSATIGSRDRRPSAPSKRFFLLSVPPGARLSRFGRGMATPAPSKGSRSPGRAGLFDHRHGFDLDELAFVAEHGDSQERARRSGQGAEGGALQGPPGDDQVIPRVGDHIDGRLHDVLGAGSRRRQRGREVGQDLPRLGLDVSRSHQRSSSIQRHLPRGEHELRPPGHGDVGVAGWFEQGRHVHPFDHGPILAISSCPRRGVQSNTCSTPRRVSCT